MGREQKEEPTKEGTGACLLWASRQGKKEKAPDMEERLGWIVLVVVIAALLVLAASAMAARRKQHHPGAVTRVNPPMMNMGMAASVGPTFAEQMAAIQQPGAQPAAPSFRSLLGERSSGQAVGAGDRVYTADQTSNTVSVIDPATNRTLGVIRLGDPVPNAVGPLYRQQVLVHGLGYSPDGRTLIVVCITTNAVVFIDTATNRIRGVVYVGRAPHEAFFTPDGREVWAAVRGEDYVSVIDAAQMREVRRVKTNNGPAQILFSPDGHYAFVPSSFTPQFTVVDARTYTVVARLPQASPFCPNLFVSGDGDEVWFTLKDSGKTQVVSGRPPFRILGTIDTGPITNHVTTVDNANGKFAYVTIGGENVVKVYRRGAPFPLVAIIPVGNLPHGIWHSGDYSHVYVALENQGAAVAIDTLTNRVIATMPIGQQTQALVYVPNAVPRGGAKASMANLESLGVAGQMKHLVMTPPKGAPSSAAVPVGAITTVSINSLGAIDLLEAAVVGLRPSSKYTLWLCSTRTAPFGYKQALGTFATNLAGAQVVQSIGPLRASLDYATCGPSTSPCRSLLITPENSDSGVLLSDLPIPAPGFPAGFGP